MKNPESSAMRQAFDAVDDLAAGLNRSRVGAGEHAVMDDKWVETYANRTEPDAKIYGHTVLNLARVEDPDGAVGYRADFIQRDNRATTMYTESYGVYQSADGDVSLFAREWSPADNESQPIEATDTTGTVEDARRLLEEIDRLHRGHDLQPDQTAVEQ